MKNPRLPYLVTTIFFLIAILPGSVMDILQPQMVVDIVEPLGLPLHLLTLIGIWKLLGVVAIATSLRSTAFPKITEWAYAGFVFDLTGAMWVHGMGGDLPGVVPPGVLLGILIASYRLRQRM